MLRVNAWHPFVATFYDDFASKATGQPLELFAWPRFLLNPIYMRSELSHGKSKNFSLCDQLLRNLANESGRQSAFAVALTLQNARNNPDALEEALCTAFTSLGFETIKMGERGKPDGVATAVLSADETGKPRQYAVSLEAKSKEEDRGKVAAGTVKISAIIRQRDDYKCQHAIVVGRDFPEKTGSALAKEIDNDRQQTAAVGKPKTITLITIDTLAELVRLRPIQQVGLMKLRDLFEMCRMPTDSDRWVESIKKTKVKKPHTRRLLRQLKNCKKFKKAMVGYGDLRVALSYLTPPIEYENDSTDGNL